MWNYCPPKDGGQFDMTDPSIAKFPPIAEMIYLKTLSISVIMCLNQHRLQCNQVAVTTGPLKYEAISLDPARNVFQDPLLKKLCFNFFAPSTVLITTAW